MIALNPAPSEGAIFAVAMSKDSSGNYHQRLHKVSLTTGKQLIAGVEITAKYPGTGEDSTEATPTSIPSSIRNDRDCCC